MNIFTVEELGKIIVAQKEAAKKSGNGDEDLGKLESWIRDGVTTHSLIEGLRNNHIVAKWNGKEPAFQITQEGKDYLEGKITNKGNKAVAEETIRHFDE